MVVEWLQDTVGGFAGWLGEHAVNMVGGGSPEDQIISSVVVGTVLFFFPEPITSLMGLVLLLVFFPFGVARLLNQRYRGGGS